MSFFIETLKSCVASSIPFGFRPDENNSKSISDSGDKTSISDKDINLVSQVIAALIRVCNSLNSSSSVFAEIFSCFWPGCIRCPYDTQCRLSMACGRQPKPSAAPGRNSAMNPPPISLSTNDFPFSIVSNSNGRRGASAAKVVSDVLMFAKHLTVSSP